MTVRQGHDGEMMATIRNEGDRPVRIQKGQRVAQSILVPVVDPSTAAGRVRVAMR